MAPSTLKLGDTLSARVDYDGSTPVVAVAGTINETSDFAPVLGLGASALRVDLGKVTRINSLGVRTWVHFVQKAEAAGIALTLEAVSPVMVQQIAMIRRFMGARSKTSSLLAPYFCTSCKAEHLHRVEVFPPAPPEPPPSITCSKCGAMAELDELATMYSNLFGA